MDSIKFLLGIESRGIKLGLSRTFQLLDLCGNPHIKKNIIQIVGTNGKGSTAYMTYKILSDAGYKTGLFTSPHLSKVNERIRINGIAISNQEIDLFIKNYKNDIINTDSSFFEVITVLAFWYFAKEEVDFAIMETGLGGRLDSVSACNPQILGITSISYDHKEILGDTIEKIALEKAGAIKTHTQCISVTQQKTVTDVLIAKAKENMSSIQFIENNFLEKINLNGDFQKINAGLAIAIVKKIIKKNIPKKNIISSLQSINWYGRIQIIKKTPLIIFDVCHNMESINGFINYIKTLPWNGKRHLLIAIQERKDIDQAINGLINNFDQITVASTQTRNSLNKKVLKEKFKKAYDVKEGMLDETINSFNSQGNKNDMLAIIGSHYIGTTISKIFKINFDNL